MGAERSVGWALCEFEVLSYLSLVFHPLPYLSGPLTFASSLLRQWYMGSDALAGSGLTHFLLYLIKDPEFVPSSEPLRRVRTSRVYAWLALELLGFAATFAITNTIAAIGFPVVVSSDFSSSAFYSFLFRSCLPRTVVDPFLYCFPDLSYDPPSNLDRPKAQQLHGGGAFGPRWGGRVSVHDEKPVEYSFRRVYIYLCL